MKAVYQSNQSYLLLESMQSQQQMQQVRGEGMIQTSKISRATTTPPADTQKTEQLTCSHLWSVAQQEAYQELSTNGKLIINYARRAQRIAGIYAKFYLETYPFTLKTASKPKQRGRFYWMGLAAFASKQVKCALDFIGSVTPDRNWSEGVNTLTAGKDIVRAFNDVPKGALGKGNFWLFQDIYVWHWVYAINNQNIATCASERNVQTYDPVVKAHVQSLPWADDALPKIKQLKETRFIKDGLDLIKLAEGQTGATRRSTLYNSLIKIANHEQRMILQPLIYEGWAFKRSLDAQAALEVLPFIPKRVAAFSTACDVDDPERRVQMTEGSLYDVEDRMVFITAVAKQYHSLMKIKKVQMETDIATIASWAN